MNLDDRLCLQLGRLVVQVIQTQMEVERLSALLAAASQPPAPEKE